MYSQSFINPHFSGLLRTNMMSAPSWLVSSVGRALHRYRKGQGMQIPYRPEFFFRFYFHYCLTSVHYCGGRFHIYSQRELFGFNNTLHLATYFPRSRVFPSMKIYKSFLLPRALLPLDKIVRMTTTRIV